MKRQKHSSIDIVDAAVEAVRRAPVPDGPSPALRSVLLAGGNNLDPAALSNLTFERKTTVKRVVQGCIAAIVVLIALGWATGLFPRNENVALADVVMQLQTAKSVKWMTVFFCTVANRDGSKTWVERNLVKHYYKAPDKVRFERLDAQGQVESVEIDDGVAGNRVEFDMKTRRARTINRTPLTEAEKSAIDPLTRIRSKIDRDAISLGKKQFGGRTVLGFRVIQTQSQPDSTADLWIDSESRQLIYVLVPGAYKFDPETDPLMKNPHGPSGTPKQMLGVMLRDIVVDANLDDSLFSFEPPKGFSSEVKTKHEPTEKDVVEWFGVLAQAHGGAFPEQIRESIEKLNEFLKKKQIDRTSAETKLIDQQNLADQGLVYPYPIDRFVSRLPRGDWHYEGNGIKLGDRSKVIFWYRPKGSKSYRVVNGDLSVTDLSNTRFLIDALKAAGAKSDDPAAVSDKQNATAAETQDAIHQGRSFLFGAMLHEAVVRGRSYLIGVQNKDGSFLDYPANDQRGSSPARGAKAPTIGHTSLAVLALLNTGMKHDDPVIAKGIGYLRRSPDTLFVFRNYEGSLAIAALVAVRDWDRDRDKISALAKSLEDEQIKTGTQEGMWSYGAPWVARGGDNSNTLFAVFGLREAAKVGVPIKQKTWERTAEHYVKFQNSDGGWGYTIGDRSTGSMTSGAIASLILCDQQLSATKGAIHNDASRKTQEQKAPERERAVKRGMEWLARHFSVSTNPGQGNAWLLYYLYQMKRAGRESGQRLFGGHNWYGEAATFVTEVQSARDGSWREMPGTENDKIVGTSFALLILGEGSNEVTRENLK